MSDRSRRPSGAYLLAALALFVSLGSTGYAAGLVTGPDVKNSSLTGQDLRNDSVTGKDIQNLTGDDLRSSSVTGDEIDEGTLSTVPSADHAQDAKTLDGFANEDFVRFGDCAPGMVRGTATVYGGADNFPVNYTASPVFVHGSSCATGQVQVRRAGIGRYYVRFLENHFNVGFVQVRVDSGDAPVCAVASIAPAGSGQDTGALLVSTFRCIDGNAVDIGSNVIVLADS